MAKTNKKAQGGSHGPPFTKAQGGEMMGLVVIVILLIVLLIVYLRFTSGPKDTSQDVGASIRNENTLAVLLNTNVCPEKKLSDAIKACANSQDVCGDEACSLVETKVKTMLKAALAGDYDAKKFRFALNYTVSGKNPVSDGGQFKCPSNTVISGDKSVGSLATLKLVSCG